MWVYKPKKKGEDENGGRSGIGEVYIEYTTTGLCFLILLLIV